MTAVLCVERLGGAGGLMHSRRIPVTTPVSISRLMILMMTACVVGNPVPFFRIYAQHHQSSCPSFLNSKKTYIVRHGKSDNNIAHRTRPIPNLRYDKHGIRKQGSQNSIKLTPTEVSVLLLNALKLPAP